MAAIIPELATLLGKATVAKDLAASAKSASEFAQKSDDVQGLLQAVMNFATSFNVAKPAINSILGSIQTQTIKAQVELMTQLLEIVQSPAGQAGVKVISDLINAILIAADEILTALTNSGYLNYQLGQLDAILFTITGVITELNTVLEAMNTNIGIINPKLNLGLGFANTGTPPPPNQLDPGTGSGHHLTY